MNKDRFDISLEDLQTFSAVADLGSFSRAAERFNLSQPSVSNRIKRLEEKLDVRLLDRTTRTVCLTPHGRRLHSRAAVTLQALQDLLKEFYAEVGARKREVEVSATLTIATVGLTPLVKRFSDDNPGITIRLQDRLPHGAIAAVLDGRSDMAVLSYEGSDARLDFQPLRTDRCVVVTGRDHPLLADRPTTLAKVLGYPLLSPDSFVSLRAAIGEVAGPRGLTVVVAPEARGVSNVLTLLAMAATGLGVCIHPSTLIPAEFRPMVELIDFEDCEIKRTFGIVTAANGTLSAAAAKFRQFLVNDAAGEIKRQTELKNMVRPQISLQENSDLE